MAVPEIFPMSCKRPSILMPSGALPPVFRNRSVATLRTAGTPFQLIGIKHVLPPRHLSRNRRAASANTLAEKSALPPCRPPSCQQRKAKALPHRPRPRFGSYCETCTMLYGVLGVGGVVKRALTT
jgi:hypothetical protein